MAVVGADIYDTLADLLSSTSQEKYTLAKSLVSSSNMQGKEVRRKRDGEKEGNYFLIFYRLLVS